MKLIDKDKVIEWLKAKKKREGWCAVGADVADVYYARGVRFTCDTCKDFLDTLEVKEVDLEKEIQDHIRECLDVKIPTTDIELIKKDVEYTARKFFELGLKAQKGE